MTQREASVRLLATQLGKWFKSYELVQKTIDGKFTGISPMERLYELTKIGYFDSKTYRYFLEHRKVGKYAEFRVSHREALPKNSYQLFHLYKQTV